MKYVKPLRGIHPDELRSLQKGLDHFYRDPPEAYHLKAKTANEDWNAPDHVFHKRITDLASPGSSVLDIGCGPAMSCSRFLEKEADYTGVEISRPQIQHNRTKFPDARFICSHWRGVAELDPVFDLVTSFFVLEHIVYPREFLEASAKCVKPKGLLAVLCPDFLKTGYLPSLHVYGNRAGGIKAHIKTFYWIDAFHEFWNRYIGYPRLIEQARSAAEKDGMWLINLRPLCLEADSWDSDWDAVYFAGEGEITNYIKALGFTIVERGKDFRDKNNGARYPDFSYVLAQKSTRKEPYQNR